MHKTVNSYNLRQLQLMIDKIYRFKEGLIGLDELIQDLEGLLNALENFDTDWKEDIRSYCIDLEVIYAVALDRDVNPEEIDTDNTIPKILNLLEDSITIELSCLNR